MCSASVVVPKVLNVHERENKEGKKGGGGGRGEELFSADDKLLKIASNGPKLHRIDKYTLNKRCRSNLFHHS